jgi:hypothetical protein
VCTEFVQTVHVTITTVALFPPCHAMSDACVLLCMFVCSSLHLQQCRYDPCKGPSDSDNQIYTEVVNKCPSQFIATEELVAFPLTTDKDLRPHKWDIRAFILVSSFDPLVVHFNHGYIHKSVCVHNVSCRLLDIMAELSHWRCTAFDF